MALTRLARARDKACRCIGLLLLAICLLLVAQSHGANAQEPLSNQNAGASEQTPRPTIKRLLPKELSDAVARNAATIERLSKAIERTRQSGDALEVIRPQVTQAADMAAANEAALRPRLAEVQRQIEELGPKPKDGAPSEAASVKAERARLEAARAEIDGAIKSADLTKLRAQQSLGRIQQLRLENLWRDLRKRRQSPLSAGLWGDLMKEMPRVGRQLSTVWDNWWTVIRDGLHWLVLALIASSLVYAMSRAWREKYFARRFGAPRDERPRYLERVRATTSSIPLLLLPALASGALVYFALEFAELLNKQARTLMLAGLQAAAIFVGTTALARSVLLPGYPNWRLLSVSTPVAGRLLTLIGLIALVYATDHFLYSVFSSLRMPLSIGVVEAALANLAFAGLLFALAWTQVPEESERASVQLLRRTLYWLRLPATIAVVAIVVSTLLGFVALGRFVAGQVMLIGSGAAALLLGHLAIRALATDPALAAGREDETGSAFSLSRTQRKSIVSVAAFLLNVAMAAAAIAFLLVSWGFSHNDILGWLKAVLFGFEIGKFRFSLVQVLIAAGLFVGLIALTRLLRRWLAKNVLAPERVDTGIANSVDTGLGYAGVALAALVAISYVGLDLSNIALIASALSIGIGFGLNAIASNFISGLIMLVERPVKVGDWVVVGDHQGYVRRISVRATEIETFDRASVIVPNSEFMTAAVQNWTHRNAMGRVVVRIGASYNAEPQRVMDVLKSVADDCELLLKYPAPSVVFEDFGASSLDFSVRGFIADVNSLLTVQTRLRLDIASAFKKEGIEIPFPQQDIHLRDLDQLRDALARAGAKRKVVDAEPGSNGS